MAVDASPKRDVQRTTTDGTARSVSFMEVDPQQATEGHMEVDRTLDSSTLAECFPVVPSGTEEKEEEEEEKKNEPEQTDEEAEESASSHSSVDEFPWDSDAFASAQRRRRLIQAACLLLVTALASIPVLLSAVQGHGLTYWPMYLCYAAVVALVVCYPVLRGAGYIGAESLEPACLLGAWLVCLLVCFGPPNRQWQLFGRPAGMEDSADVEFFCEEGSTAMWLALVLLVVALLVPTRTGRFVALAAAVVAQYLLLAIALPRPECDIRGGRRSIAPMLWLPPIWASVFQLVFLVVILALLRIRVDATRHMQEVLLQFVEGHFKNKDRSLTADRNSLVLHGWIDRVLEDIEREECECRNFLREVYSVMPRGTSDHMWAAAVGRLMQVIGNWRGLLMSQANSKPHQADIVARVMEMSSAGDAHTNMQAVSHYVRMSSIDNQEGRKTRRSITGHQLIPEDESLKRRAMPLVTIPGLTDDLRIGAWDFDALGVERDGQHVLQVTGFELLRCFNFLPRSVLSGFLSRLEASYVAANPYHSHVHAADVCNAVFFLASKTGLWREGMVTDSRSAALILAALGHDVGHPGRNNTFVIASRHELAITYNDRSPLEQYHAATLVRLLGERDHDHAHVLQDLSTEKEGKIRLLITALILGTDTQKHLEDLGAFRLRLGAEAFDPLSEENDLTQSLAMLFRAADIGHSAKRWDLHVEWSGRVVQEFHAQGDEEKELGLQVSPLCAREGFKLAASQVGFLQFVCLPTWKELSRFEETLERLRCISRADRTLSKKATVNMERSPCSAKAAQRAATLGASSIGTKPAPGAPAASGFFPVGPQATLPFVVADPALAVVADGGYGGSTNSSGMRRQCTRTTTIAERCTGQCEANFSTWCAQAERERGDH